MRIGFYVINLEGSADRLADITAQMDAAGVGFTRVAAFDGRGQPVEGLPLYDAAASVRYMGRGLRGGEVGCFLSHRRAAEAFLRTDQTHAVVLEDDAGIGPDFVPVTAALAARRDDWDVANLGNGRCKVFTPMGKIDAHRLVAAHYFPMTTTGLMWTRQGAEAFLREMVIDAPVDNFLRHWQLRRRRGLALIPPIIAPTGAASLIHANRPKVRKKRTLTYVLRKRRRLIIDAVLAWRAKRAFSSKG